MRKQPVTLFIILLLTVTSCSQQGGLSLSHPSPTPNTITTAKAQMAVDQAIEILKRQFGESAKSPKLRIVGNGKANVGGVQDRPQENIAVAEVSYIDLANKCAYFLPPYRWEGGEAIFTHYNDGRWVLTKLTTGEMMCGPSFTFKIDVK